MMIWVTKLRFHLSLSLGLRGFLSRLMLATLAVMCANSATRAFAFQIPNQNAPAAGTTSPAAPIKPTSPTEANERDPTEVPVIRQEVREIRLLVTATDKHGRFVRTLTASSFAVLDDGQDVGPFLDFRSEANLPLEVGLVVDLSGSVRGRFPFAQESVAQFLKQVLRPATDRGFLAGFNQQLTVYQGLTSDTALLAQSLNRLQPGGGTALFDAVVQLCQRQWSEDAGHGVGGRLPAKSGVRRAMVLLTDGNDNQSDAHLADAIAAAQRAEVVVYAINTSDSPTVERGDKYLSRLTEATGGRVFYPSNHHDVDRALAETEEELRSQYVVSFRPAGGAGLNGVNDAGSGAENSSVAPNGDGKFHTLTLRPHVAGVQLRTRRGYYAR